VTSAQPSHSSGQSSDGRNGQPAGGAERRFPTLVGSLADDQATANRPTFTARPGPAVAPEPSPADTPGAGLDLAPVPPAAPEPPGAAGMPGAVGMPDAFAADEPLLADAAGLHARWQRVQAGFVDDPQEAVGDAADLIEQTAQALVGALRQRQRALRVQWERGPADDAVAADGQPVAGGPDTERLRLIMQHYRGLFNPLCRP
jgi:hypothetical protein